YAPDHLAPSEEEPPCARDVADDSVAHRGQRRDRCRRDALLEMELYRAAVWRPYGGGGARLHAKAGAVELCLGRRTLVTQRAHHLHMPLRLHEAAHDAEGAVEAPVGVRDHAGDDRVVRTLARVQDVGVAGLEDEARAAILQAEAPASVDVAGTGDEAR